MKTQYELKFEELVTKSILSNEHPICSRLDVFMDFHRNSSVYYDFLCDALYVLASGASSDTLWLTPSGRPYLAPQQQAEWDMKLLSSQQVPAFQDDLVEQLEVALAALRDFEKATAPCL